MLYEYRETKTNNVKNINIHKDRCCIYLINFKFNFIYLSNFFKIALVAGVNVKVYFHKSCSKIDQMKTIPLQLFLFHKNA